MPSLEVVVTLLVLWFFATVGLVWVAVPLRLSQIMNKLRAQAQAAQQERLEAQKKGQRVLRKRARRKGIGR